MRTMRMVVVATVIVASGLVLHVARAQQAGIRRIDLQRHDLSVPGREVVQAIVELDPGVTSSRHTHPGEEIIYVLEGAPLEYEVEGKPPVTLKPGDVLSSRPERSTRRRTSAAERERSWPRMSSKKGNRSSLR
jgi:quercetin dioxygenase-like cupin family protein